MSSALFVLTAGRVECLERTVASAREMLRGDISERWMLDDTGDDEHRAWLRDRFPDFTLIDSGPHRGFGSAMRAAWCLLYAKSKAKWVFGLEEDYVFCRPVDVDLLGSLLDAHPRLAQIALLRQPWYGWERQVGGIVEAHPDAYTAQEWQGHPWLEHRVGWTCNPSLYPRRLMARRWPDGVSAEGTHAEDRFSRELFADPHRWSAGYWGDGTPWVEHIGYERAGDGY